MSAFVVSDEHINAMVTAAMDYRSRHMKMGYKPYGESPDPQELATILRAENERSVRYRYREDADKYNLIPPDPITYRRTGTKKRTAGKVLGWLACYDYQACECPDYRHSAAWRIVEEIREAVISTLPGRDGTWHYLEDSNG